MIWNTLVLAVKQMRRNAMRSFLTILGIVIGVSAVITMVSLGNGATQAVSDQISSLGSNLLRDAIALHVPAIAAAVPAYHDFRPGDVRHSQADIGKARRLLGYAPTHRLLDGIRAALPWYLAHYGIAPIREGRFAGAT